MDPPFMVIPPWVPLVMLGLLALVVISVIAAFIWFWRHRADD